MQLLFVVLAFGSHL